MTKRFNQKFALMTMLGLFSSMIFAFQCPDPAKSSLAWGEAPLPWQVNPYSANRPQGEKGTYFVRAQLLVTGALGQGISCTYRNSIGNFSIWWQTRCKVPAYQDNYWVGEQSGYVCSMGIKECNFVVAE